MANRQTSKTAVLDEPQATEPTSADEPTSAEQQEYPVTPNGKIKRHRSVLCIPVGDSLPGSGRGGRSTTDRYLAVLDQILDADQVGEWFQIGLIPYKSGAAIERRKLDKGEFDSPTLSEGYSWEFASRTVKDEDGSDASGLFARVVGPAQNN